MGIVYTIFSREFKTFFVSPIAYVCITVFMILTGYLFFMGLSQFALDCLKSMQWAQYYQKPGTIELLVTAPITYTQIIIGKYLASLALFVLMISLTLIYQVVLFVYGEPELWPIVSGYFGLFLLGSSYIAIGTFISSFTENQVVAGFISFGILLLLMVINWAENFVGPVFGTFLSYISLLGHFDDFAKGIIDTKHIIYYFSCIFLSLFLTERSLESARWHQ